ncbi:recombinase family protein [Caenispirillum salinarum]|uniref:recombinase family protein n=1 Tax=Caenispirillum salinarum TaxID=859058 RepID=UPI00384A6537
MFDAVRAKARRGELRISVPIGYIWHRDIGLGFDPDIRLQQVIRLVFERFRQLGSARQTHLSLATEGVVFPRPSDGKRLTSFDWTPIRYRNVIGVLKNPFCAGAYAYGKSEKRIAIVDGRARKSYGHGKPPEEWEVLTRDHHEGYIDWMEYERNQALLAANAYGRVGGQKSGRGGRALLAGILTCGRCGRGLAVAYTGAPPGRPELWRKVGDSLRRGWRIVEVSYAFHISNKGVIRHDRRYRCRPAPARGNRRSADRGSACRGAAAFGASRGGRGRGHACRA